MALGELHRPVVVPGSADLEKVPGRHRRDRRRRSWWWSWLVLGWLAQVGVRLVLAAGQSTPVVTPDEMGYLYAARLLTDLPIADLSKSTHYRGGYSLLLLPAFWLSDDPLTAYRIAIGINALVSALILVLAYQLLRRLKLTRGQAYGLAHATALLPAGVFYTQFALSDAVLPVVVLGWLLLTHSWLAAEASRPRVALYGAGAAFLAGYAYMTHSRGLVIVAVHGVLLLAVVACRWRPWWSAGLGVLVLGGVVSAGWLLNKWIWTWLYSRGSWGMGALVRDRLTTLDGYAWTVPVGLGQIWYLIIATWGLGGIGLVAAMATVLRRRVPPPLRIMAIVVVVTVAGIAFATAAALPDEQRVGNHAYSRYLACLAPALFAVGAAVLLRARRHAALGAAAAAAVLMLAGAWMIELDTGAKLRDYEFVSFDFPETGFLTWDWASFRLWTATPVALGMLAVMLVLTIRRRRWYGVVALTVALVAVNAVASTTAAVKISHPVARDMAAAAGLRGVIDPAAKPWVAIDQRIGMRIWLVQAYYVSWAPVLWFNGRTERPPARADVVLVRWRNGVPAERTWTSPPAGWRVAEARRNGGWVAWERG